MSHQEIFTKINQILADLSDEHLEAVLAYLKQVNAMGDSDIKWNHNLSKIIKEDTALLKRLAQ